MPTIEIRTPDGGHAFDNHDAPMFSRPEAAARTGGGTREFLARRVTPSR